MMVWSFKSVVPCSKAGNLFTLFRWLFAWDCRLEVLPSEVVFFCIWVVRAYRAPLELGECRFWVLWAYS